MVWAGVGRNKAATWEIMLGVTLLITFNILPLFVFGQLMKLRYLVSSECQVRSDLLCPCPPVVSTHLCAVYRSCAVLAGLAGLHPAAVLALVLLFF